MLPTKIDKLVFRSFFAPFLLTFSIVEFILLTVFISKYFQDLVGKDLGMDVYAELIFYFAINQIPLSLPLTVLLSSLMAFGNLGEHYEITAIKSAGISLLRVLLPVAVYAVFITFAAFLVNNYVVPPANLKAYRLMYDVRQKKPALELREGGFYYGLPGYAIRIEAKEPGTDRLFGVMIYDHTTNRGNKNLILSDTGRMFTTSDEKYLVMELQKGTTFTEPSSYNSAKKAFKRDYFEEARFVFPLASFQLQNTDEDLFKSHRVMRNIEELQTDIDSLRGDASALEAGMAKMIRPYFDYLFHSREIDEKMLSKDSVSDDYRLYKANIDSIEINTLLEKANIGARKVLSFAQSNSERIRSSEENARTFHLTLLQKFTLSFACFVMFMIGAPLGVIIKKGGLGVPVLISIMFFLLFYVLFITGEKYAKTGQTGVYTGAWASDAILFCIGLFFLRQARNDSRIFDADIYFIWYLRFKDKYGKYFPKFKKKKKAK